VLTETRGRERRAQISVQGLDRQPSLAPRIVQALQRKFGVRARARPLTGHVTVEFDRYRVLLEELLAEVAHMQLPTLPGEDRPAHPLDPAPLFEGACRAIGCLVGIGILTFRRLAFPGALAAGHGIAGWVAAAINLLHGFPFIRKGLRRLFGQTGADLASNSMGIVAMTVADSPLGLIVTGVESLLFLGEVTARRSSWRRYEDRLDAAAPAEPGAVVRLEAGMTVPRAARVIEGTGSAAGDSGLPMLLSPGATAPAGALLAGGPFVLELQGGPAFVPEPRPVPPRRTLYDQYLRLIGPISLAYAGVATLRTGSLARTFEGLLLLNPRTAVIGLEAANLGAAARALRGGATVVGTRPDRPVQLPHVLLLDGPRLLTAGLEIAEVLPPSEILLAADVLALASLISAAAGAPWGSAFPKSGHAQVSGGTFNGLWATATVDGVRYTLGPPEDPDLIPDDFVARNHGGYVLELRQQDAEEVFLGLVALRLRIRPGVFDLVETCQRLGVGLELLTSGTRPAAAVVGSRTGIPVTQSDDDVATIRRRQQSGAIVAFLSDHAEAAPAFAACDLAVGLVSGQGDFPARADVMAPDLKAVADVLEAGARREAAIRDAVRLSALANGAGAVLGLFQGAMGAEQASLGVYLAALAAMGAGWRRLGGGLRPEAALAFLSDPRPERWGRRSVAEVLKTFKASADGLTDAEALHRRVPTPAAAGANSLWSALRNQLTTPITRLLAGGACLALVLGQPINTALLSLTISLNVAAGVWQEREVGRAAEELERLASGTAAVLRNGQSVKVPWSELVPGDILVLKAGDRVAADARIVTASSLEVDEAALTGESLPVAKGPDEVTDSGRIVLEGSDVVLGTGRAVVVAVGRHTRLGATAEALNVERLEESPMGARLGRILEIALPMAASGGAIAGLAGLLYGAAPLDQLTIAVTTALSAIPEGLPLLAGVGQAGVASRLAARRALVRRVAAVEALGRVDVACTDKTGTLTEGRLALRLVADHREEAFVPGPLSPQLRRVLRAGALASPHPDSEGAHPTDRAVLRGALGAELGDDARSTRDAEVPFDSARAFHATRAHGRIYVKGAPERLLPRCTAVMVEGKERRLDQEERWTWLSRGSRLAERGLRVLMVAEGPAPPGVPSRQALENPEGLTALGFLGISDPLRPTVPGAVRRCLGAGIRVMMLTGDHPATATAIAREAGLLIPGCDRVLRAAELADAEWDGHLDGVAVVARAAPLDKLRIIESLRRRGHVVAMTGDGVNDAPSLRLADVGVAMGRTGTEVARQAADVVLTDDDFATLVEALVEGRGFWRNMRNALGLLLGGNAGELSLIVGATLLGFSRPLDAVQILLVNMITDALPSLAVVLQRPEHRHLAGLAREGLSALDHGLRRDIIRRGVATGIPSIGAYLFMQAAGGPQQASAVAFTSVVTTQLAQTLDVGRVEGILSRPVVGAVAASLGLLVATVSLPPIRNSLGLFSPSPLGWGVVAASSAAAVVISRAISLPGAILSAIKHSHEHGPPGLQSPSPAPIQGLAAAPAG
jgi:calcium-translocating P-type ATPase